MADEDQARVGEETLLAAVADEYGERLKRGEQPDVEEYARRHPELAEEIRGMLPTLRAMAAAREEGGEKTDGLEAWLEDHQLGDYRILREIGHGGMGTVYEAEQISLGRRVALKVLPLAALLDPRLLRRFKQEAQAAARLHHEHIVPVHAVGFERGVHYYVMAYIEGASLAEVIAELRAAVEEKAPSSDAAAPGSSGSAGGLARQLLGGEGPRGGGSRGSRMGHGARNRSFFRAVAQLGREAAEALAHAHAQGVIHRDIKPSNLLLDVEGRLWVTDFGLAHYPATDGDALTLPGDLLGTIRYMSPEQAGGKPALLDARTDVYSLGVTLYELLCLRPAFDGGERAELLRQVIEEEPPAPRQLNDAIPVDLETVVLKAMAKEPALRYASAEALAADLERFLEDRPIQARRAGMSVRLRKWVQRHWWSTVAGVVGLLALSLVTGGSAWRLARARALTQIQRDLAVRERERADANYRLALKVLEQGVLDVLKRELPRGQLDPGERRQLRQALDFYEGFLRQNEGLREAREAVGRAYQQVGGIQRGLGQYQEAAAAYQRSRTVFEQLLRENPENRTDRRRLVSVLVDYGQLLNEMGRPAEAREAALRAVEVARHWQGRDDVSPAEQQALAASHGLAAEAWEQLGKPDRARAAREAQWALARKLAVSAPARTSARETLAASRQGLAETAAARGDWAAAERHYRAARAGCVSLAGPEMDSPRWRARLAATQAGLGEALLRQGRVKAARDPLWDGFAEQRALMEEFPARPEYRVGLIRISASLVRLLRALGRTTEAEQRAQDALALWSEVPVASRAQPAALTAMSELCAAAGAVFAKNDHRATAERLRADRRRYAALAGLARARRRKESLVAARAEVEAAFAARPAADPSLQRLRERIAAPSGPPPPAGPASPAPPAGPRAVHPSPPDGGRLPPSPEACLRWEAGAGAVAYQVYGGRNPEQLSLLARAPARAPYSVPAPKLARGQWYAWRVDAVLPGGTVARGATWAFRAPGLVAWWPMEDDDVHRVKDASGQGHDGIFRRGARVIRDPERGAVLQLGPGSGGYLECDNDPVFHLTGGFTLAAWVRCPPPPGLSAPAVIIGKGKNSWRLFACPGGRFSLHESGVRTTSSVQPVTEGMGVEGRNSLPDGEWHHVTVTSDGRKVTLYLDGREDTHEWVVSGGLRTNQAPVTLGLLTAAPEDASRASHLFHGCVDDVRVYDAVLSRDEVVALRSRPPEIPEPRPAWAPRAFPPPPEAGRKSRRCPAKAGEKPLPEESLSGEAIEAQMVCESEGLLGAALGALGHETAALRAHQAQLAAAKTLAGRAPDTRVAWEARAESHRGLATLEAARGRWAEAVADYQAAARAYEELRGRRPESFRYRAALAEVWSRWGNALGELGRRREAEDKIKQGLAALLALLETHPDSATLARLVGESAEFQSRLLLRAGFPAQAEQFLLNYLNFQHSFSRELRAGAEHQLQLAKLGALWRRIRAAENLPESPATPEEDIFATEGVPAKNAPPDTQHGEAARDATATALPHPTPGGCLVPGNRAWLRWKATPGAAAYRVYLGPDPEHLTLITRRDGSKPCRARPPKLAACHWYAWRVDTVRADGSVNRGPTWAFSTGDVVGWWPFAAPANASVVADRSGYGHPGKLLGGARVVDDPERGPVLELPGGTGACVDCGAASLFDLTRGFTISVWMRTTSLAGSFFPALLAKGDQTWRLHGLVERHTVCLHLQGLKTDQREFGAVRGSSLLDDGAWHHIGAVFDGRRMRLYVDGRLEDEAVAFAGALPVTRAPLRIGHNYPSSYFLQRYFKGRLDDVRLFNTALNRQELEAVRRGAILRRPPPPSWAG